MAREFIGGKGADSAAPDLVEVAVDTQCEECFAPATKVYYNRESKTLIVTCAESHESELAGNWEWVVNGRR